MANYSNLKTAIENAVDWNNGDNEITGQNLLDILETIIDSLGAKYKFADVATPASSITTPDEPLFYLAGAGTYTNFSGLSVTIPRGTLAIFYYDTAWHYTTVRTDSDAFFNVNQYLGAPSTTYTKANGRNAVPSALRSKGMIITYLTTNGWIIEQNLSTSGTWNADANWQTIGPVSVSQNTETGHININVGNSTVVAASPDEINQNYINTQFHLTKAIDRKRIYGPFKAGTDLKMIVSNYSYDGSGDRNINIQYIHNGSLYYQDVYYTPSANAIRTTTLTYDTDYIIVVLGYIEPTTSVSADITILYGSALIDFADVTPTVNEGEQLNLAIQKNDGSHSTPNNKNIAEFVIPSATIEKAGLMSAQDRTVLSENTSKLSTIDEVLNVDEDSRKITGALSDWGYTSPIYVGFVKPFEKDSKLKSIKIVCFTPDADKVGTTLKLVVGTIDQRNWLLVDKEYDVTITSISSLTVTLDCSNVFVPKGKVVFLRCIGLNSSSPSVTFAISSAAYDENLVIGTTANLSNPISYKTWGLALFEVTYVTIDTNLATKEELEPIKEDIATINSQLAEVGKYTDTITGDKYKIKVANGQIVLQLLNYSKILFIGHSFLSYSNSPEADWFLPNGQDRAMAPSVYDNEWAAFVVEKYGATMTKKSGVAFERQYSPDYDFATNWNVSDVYDAICVYLGDNANYSATMQESWEAMLNYLKTAAPSAEIFCTAGWSAGDKATAIANACINVSNINYVNLVGLDVSSLTWRRGDYYIGRNDKYYPQGAAAAHPSDIGHFTIASKFLEVMSGGTLANKTKSLTLVQSNGGTIVTRNLEQVVGSVVSIECVADSGKYISGMSVVDSDNNAVQATLRVNAARSASGNVYYTFIMPNKDVTITPSWSSTQNYTTYSITVSDTTYGSIHTLNGVSLEGARCYLLVQPQSGHTLSSISAKDASNNNITLTQDGNNVYYFDMPASNVTVIPIWG